MKNIFLYSKSNKTLYKTYKINLYNKNKNKFNIIKLGIYNSKLNIISCIYYILLKFLKCNFILNKNLFKLLLYKIKNKRNDRVVYCI
ncbi:hypothetical protein PMUG01_API003700 (apicoplast) [Plasmodium malariae]|uniref:Open reading frame 79 n=1 Tax=Plasmodium malariae TaxID=5858 RepID=H7CDG3_PLAMA|nr:hypothetical protein PMUG01_API003700 [Plasmodium malariae]BAL70583.1 open reading frame 79 [Plasmodium malariae]SBT86802.1 hypothetical protein PMUG01_API003700 [Plasmodium malariae]